MRTCVCNGKGSGVQVLDSDCRLQGVTVVGSDTGFSLDRIRSNAVLADCKAVDVTEMGVRVQGAGARVRIQGFEMRQPARQQQVYGIVVHFAGRADLVSCKLAAGSEGPAVVAQGERTEVGGEDCQLSGCEGAYACEGAQVTLRRCATRDCVSCGYSVDDRSVLTLHNCTSTGDDVGFFCLGHLHAQDCELRRFCTGADVISEQGIGGGDLQTSALPLCRSQMHCY